MRITWTKCKELKKEINLICEDRRPEWKRRPIEALDAKGIQRDIVQLCDHLEGLDPGEWQAEFDFPPMAVELWEEQQKRDKEKENNGFFPKVRANDKILVGLKPSALRLWIVYTNHAWTGVDWNKKTGMGPGEHFLGNKAASREAKVSFSHMHEYKKELTEAGLMAYVRKHPRYGTNIYRMAMEPVLQPASREQEQEEKKPVAAAKPDVEQEETSGQHCQESRAEFYAGEEWENFESSFHRTEQEGEDEEPCQTRWEPAEGRAEDDQTPMGQPLTKWGVDQARESSFREDATPHKLGDCTPPSFGGGHPPKVGG